MAFAMPEQGILQKVALAQANCRDPPIFGADAPGAVLISSERRYAM
jgi:hypothetical protein